MALATLETNGMTVEGITNRLLRRADFYELRRIQGLSFFVLAYWELIKLHTAHFQSSLLVKVTVESLSPAAAVLATISTGTKLPKNLRSIKAPSMQSLLSTFAKISVLIPIDYFGKSLKNDLIERALGLDIFISARKVDGFSEQEISAGQVILRRFVEGVRGNGGSIVSTFCFSHCIVWLEY